MGKFILRVDDVGWFPPEKTRDAGLKYFEEWRKAIGLEGCPVYYGAIPNQLQTAELDWMRKNLQNDEELSVHGSTHTKGEKVDVRAMRGHRELFDLYRRCRSYIPPFNDYTTTDKVTIVLDDIN